MKDLKTIKNIIFDLGGVLLNIDYNLTVQAFKRLGISEFDKIYSQATQKELFDKYEKGLITSKEFRQALRSLLKMDLADMQIDRAWNAMLLDLPVERIQLLEKLGAEHRLFLLSNTNEIHIACYSDYLHTTFGFSNLSHIFSKEYYSYEIGMRKPEEEIFNRVLIENNLNPGETLFVDDSLQHIKGASQTGIQTIWLEQGKTILDIFIPSP